MKSSLKLLFGCGLALGIGSLIVSYSWTRLFPLTNKWTNRDQAKLGEAQVKYHELTYTAGMARNKSRPNAAQLEIDLRHWKAEWEKLNGQLEDVKNHNRLVEQILYWCGIALIVFSTGGILYFRDEPPEKS